MEHDPLRDSDNTLLRLIESGELRFDSIIRIRHGRSCACINKVEMSMFAVISRWNRMGSVGPGRQLRWSEA